MPRRRRRASSWRGSAARSPTASIAASTGSPHCYPSIVRVLVGSWIALVAMLAVFAGLIYATVYMVQSGAARLHPDARPGLCDRRRPAAGRRLAVADRRGRSSRRRRSSRTTPGRRQRGRLRRLLRRDLHQCQQCRRDLRGVQAVRRAARRPASPRSRSSAICSAACRASRRPSSSRCRRRRSAASAMPAASRCSCRSATAPTCARSCSLPTRSPARPTRRRG